MHRMSSSATVILGIMVTAATIGIGLAQEKPAGRTGGEVWYNGDRAEKIWFADDQIYVINEQNLSIDAFVPSTAASIPLGTVVETGSRGVRLELPEGLTATSLLNGADVVSRDNETRYAAVYYSNGTEDDAVLVQSGEMVVFPAPGTSLTQLDSVVAQKGQSLTRLQTLMNGTAALYSCPSDRSCLDIANDLRGDSAVRFSYPDWIKTRPTRSGTKTRQGNSGSTGQATRFTVDDPLFPDQWHLTNTGQNNGVSGEDVNIQGAWDLGLDGYSNGPTYVAIVDDGLELAHEDIAGNAVAGAHLDLVDNDLDPTPGPGDFHGSSVGGIAGAEGLNSLGVAGAAPAVGLMGIRLLGPGTTDSDEAAALNHNLTSVEFPDIYNNSWGPADSGALAVPGPLAEAALANGVVNGREGLGAIYTWAGGNGLANEDNSNYDGYANSRYTISVGASNNIGTQSSYSEPGANILVNSSSSGNGVGTTTTDITGANGYSPDNYTSNFGGTSSSAPLVAGIVALMLDANTNLGWRDIQKLLATTAEKNDPTDADWTQNGAGYWINHKYGFGRIDATAAAVAASSWSNLPAEISNSASLAPGASIPQPEGAGGSLFLTIPLAANIQIEHVYLTVDSDHTYWGDLEIKLMSPDGTVSVMSETHGSGPGDQLNGGYRFSTVRSMGEESAGSWQLQITDNFDGDTGLIVSVVLEVFGTPLIVATCNGEPVDVFIANGDTPTSNKDVIQGTAGADTINGMGGDDVICGKGGADAINGGRGNDWIDAGEGDDYVLGAADNDTIFGQDGDDLLEGGPGNDDISGEAGDDVIFGNSGADDIDGGDGVDDINGGSGADIIAAGAGSTVGTASFINGGSGNDIITGGPDNDYIRSSTGNDTINGGGGNDELFGGGGEDTVNGEDGDDFIRGNAANDIVSGGNGTDNVDGGSSKDQVYGGAGDDYLKGSTGNDKIYGGTGNDEMLGGGGNDELFGEAGDDLILGGGSNDSMNGGDGTADNCDGEGGVDTATECETESNVP